MHVVIATHVVVAMYAVIAVFAMYAVFATHVVVAILTLVLWHVTESRGGWTRTVASLLLRVMRMVSGLPS